jgi:glycerate-2-kinase
LILNREELASFHGGESSRLVLSALEDALGSVEPGLLVRNCLTFDNGILIRDIHGKTSRVKDFHSIYVVGAGKAAAAMANGLCSILGDRITEGVITVPYGDKPHIKTGNESAITVNEASHPLPDNSGLRSSRKILGILHKAAKNDLVFVLISGGGSALMPLPANELELADKLRITSRLLRSGANIHEMNIVRKHLSSVKGGQLLRHIEMSCSVVSLILSDVVDDDIAAIASGPTSPDSSTFADAIRVVKKYRAARASDPALRYLGRGAEGKAKETPKPGDPIFSRVTNVLIGNNSIACRAAVTSFEKKGVPAAYLGSQFDGEANRFGSFLANIAEDLSRVFPRPFALVMGGETVVKLGSKPAGIGGRNQEAALSCAVSMKHNDDVAVACIGTDGIDGNSDAAGAIVSSRTISLARSRNLNLRKYLAGHDSYRALGKLSSVIFTGRTETNVNDIAVICRAA